MVAENEKRSSETPATLPFGPYESLLMETNGGCLPLPCMPHANWVKKFYRLITACYEQEAM